MSITCEKCSQQPRCPLWCQCCQQVCCTKCYSTHTSHQNKLVFLCQQCQQVPKNVQKMKTVFCENCQQHLCLQCSQRIHNKGKRAKHTLHNTSYQTMKIRRLYIACDDVLGYYGYYNYGVLLMDLGDFVPINQTFLLMVQKPKDVADIKTRLPVLIRSFNSQKQLGEDFCQNSKALYPFLQQIIFIESHRSCKLYDSIKQTKSIKTTLHRLGQVVQKPVHSITNISMSSISLQNNSLNNKSNISAKYPRQTKNQNQFSMNISSSTQNSLRKRKRKSPILYFHPFTCLKGDKRCWIQNYYRQLASKGTLMVRKDQCKMFEEGILRAFYRNIGETQVEYVSLLLDTVSIQCLYWVIRSIQQDQMAPTQKLILSRLKQSFDIKVHSKLWNYIMKYLSSSQYQNDRLEVDPMGNIPRLLVKPFNSEDSYILYCKADNFTPIEWVYEDLSKLNENSDEWKQFIELINQYFQKNSQIGGGRYGCVQYIKFNANKPLKNCSLGKLSMFVQQAINKGIIRYHKTLLVSNRQNQQSQHSQCRTDNKQTFLQLQKSVKIQMLQLLLIDNFTQYGEHTPISLAQIPQNLRKSSPFEINYIELGFPKLKNFLATLSNILHLQLSKSHIMYSIKPQTEQLIKEKREKLLLDTNLLIQEILKELVEVMDGSKMVGMAIDQLYNQFGMKNGAGLEFSLFRLGNFYDFLLYYGQNYFDIQFQMGYFMVYKKWQSQSLKNSDSTSTPTFKQTQGQINYKLAKLNLQWQQDKNIWLDSGQKVFTCLQKQKQPPTQFESGYEQPQPEQPQNQNESQTYSDWKSIYNIIDDTSESKSYPKTVIIKEGDGSSRSKQCGNGLLIESKFSPIEEFGNKGGDGEGSGYGDGNWGWKEEGVKEFDQVMTIKVNKGQHNRMYSNNTQQKTQHFRVYSNMSRD